jgi:hypothetical protein
MHSDKELLDYLQKMLDAKRYTGKCVLRWSSTGRGFRLHETSLEGSCNNIRKAISDFIDEQSSKAT